MIHFAEINQLPSPYSMLQDIGRVATPKLIPRNCLRYILADNTDRGGVWGRGGGRVGDWSHNLYEVLKMPASEFMDNPHSCCPIFPALLVCRTRGEGGFTEALVFFYYYLKPLY